MILDTFIMQARGGRPAVSNIPTLAHFFPMDETSGKTVSDTKGGLVYTPTEISFGANTVRPHEPLNGYSGVNAIPAIPLTSGNIVDIGKRSACVLAIGVLNTDMTTDNGGRVWFGADLGAGDISPGIGPGISTTNAEIAGAINTGTTANDHYTARPTTGGVADGVEGDLFILDLQTERTTPTGTVKYTRTNYSKSTNTTTTISLSEGGSPSFELAPDCTPEDFIAFRGIDLYGIALFVFEGAIPANYGAAVDWMRWAWTSGYKTIYPSAVNWT